MIWIDNGTGYYIFKITTLYFRYCRYIRLIHISWFIQFLDINSIKNLWWIIKPRVSA